MRKGHWFSLGISVGMLLAVGFGFASSVSQRAGQTGQAVGAGGETMLIAASGSSSAAAAASTDSPPDDGKLRIIAFGAHPDDCEFKAGGAAAMWSALGHHVKFVSTTNGDIGHWRMAGGPLAKRRTAEVYKAAEILGISSEVLDIHDGEIMPTLENRRTFTRLIRRWKADIVMTHRTNDYHPDHRYTGILVQDSSYMVTVPFFCPDTPRLSRNPVFLHYSDGFQVPTPFAPDVVVAIDSVIEQKVEATVALESQVIEGGCGGNQSMVPKTDEQWEARRKDTRQRLRRRYANVANRYREKLIELYGEEAGKKVRYAEAFAVSEHGRRPSKQELRRLFPFLPKQ